MQNTSDYYKNVYANNHYAEVRLEVYSSDGNTLIHTFGMNRLVSMQTTRSGLPDDGFTVGACIAGQIDVVLYPTDSNGNEVTIPSAARLVPKYRIWFSDDPERAPSEWIKKGVYWLDERKKDTISGKVSLHGYDAIRIFDYMVTTIRSQNQSGLNPVTPPEEVTRMVTTTVQDVDVMDYIAQVCNITVDPRTYNVITGSYYVNSAYKDYTARQVLSYIAQPYCASFVMSDEGKLLAIDIEAICSLNAPIVEDIQGAVTDFKKYDPHKNVSMVIINGVEYPSATPGYYKSGANGGTVIELVNPWGTQAMADDIRAKLFSYSYQPYEATGAKIDPAVEIGDKITVMNFSNGLFMQTLNFDVSMTSQKIGAPSSGEITSEIESYVI